MQTLMYNNFRRQRMFTCLGAMIFSLICVVIFCSSGLCDSNPEVIWTDGKEVLLRKEVNLYLSQQGHDWTHDNDFMQLIKIELKMYKAKENLVPIFRERLANTQVIDYEAAAILQFVLDGKGDYSELVDSFRIQCQHSETHVVRFAVLALGEYGNKKDISTIASFLNSDMHISDTNNISVVQRACLSVLEAKGNKRHEQEIQKFINKRDISRKAKNQKPDRLEKMAKRVLEQIKTRGDQGHP